MFDSEDTPKLNELIQVSHEGQPETNMDKDNRIRQLENKIQHLQCENCLLRNKVLALEYGDGLHFPELALVVIFRHLARSLFQKTLLGCRLVCRAWRNAFDSTSNLWQNFTFSCPDPQVFLQLRCLNQIKSISFKKLDEGRQFDDERTKCLVEISKTIERVSFVFDRSSSSRRSEDRQTLVFSTFLSNCAVLHTLHIRGTHFAFLSAIPPVPELKGSSITQLEVDVDHMQLHDILALKYLIVRLHGLRRIAFTIAGDNYDGDVHVILNILEISTEYMDNHPGVLQTLNLTRIFDIFDTYLLEPYWTTWVILKLTACKHGVSVNAAIQDNLNQFLACVHAIADNWDYYAEILDAKIKIPNNELLTNVHQITFCGNLESLKINLEMSATVAELSGLTTLKRLSKLVINGYSGIIPQLVFVGGIPSLTMLTCDYGGFDPDIYSYFADYFPNLKHFSINNCCNQIEFHADFIASLAKLEKLNELKLRRVKLTDAGLASGAEFQLLKKLTIIGSSGLTDACLLNGICHIKHWKN